MNAVSEILELILGMTEMMELANCKLSVPEELSKVRYNDLVTAHKWLVELQPSHRAAQKARRCVPEAVWGTYCTMGIFDLQECVLWDETSTVLRKKIRSMKRPDLFIKSKHKKIMCK